MRARLGALLGGMSAVAGPGGMYEKRGLLERAVKKSGAGRNFRLTFFGARVETDLAAGL